MAIGEPSLGVAGSAVDQLPRIADLRVVGTSDSDWTSSQVGFGLVQQPAPIAELLRREQTYRWLLASADAIAALVAVLSAAWLLGLSIRWPIIGLPFFAILVAKVQGLYDRDEMVIRKSTIEEWRALLQAITIASICVYLSWRVLTSATQGAGMRIFLLLVASTTLLALIGRTLARNLARRLMTAERCLIVGDMDRCTHLAQTISAIDGVELVGGTAIEQLGRSTPNDLWRLVTDLDLHRLIIAPDAGTSDAVTLELVRAAKLLGVRVSILPSVLAAVGGCAAFDELDGHTLLGVPRFGLTKSSAAIKRALDLIGSVLALVLLSPVMLGIALAIRLDSRGPVLFRQTRVGRNGKPFQMLKFRSMVDGAETIKRDLLDLNEARSGLFKIANDPRTTRTGRVLRVMHLDELPQLFHVVRGEMSLVGPRPLVAEEDGQIAGADRIRLSLTPGITGPWQICGPMTTPLSEMVKLDYLYISGWSLWRDVDILLKTAVRVLDRGGH
ncbi:MAG: exopolysaccharide biosynthesis polyprenyl glycosylphosphotransferase [Solirubrobacteraceae bacterium]